MKTGMKKEVVVEVITMNNTKLFFDQEGGEWGKDSRDIGGGMPTGGGMPSTDTAVEVADTAGGDIP